MKLNSPESIEEAAKVFRSYGGSWTAARAAGQRDKDGVLVIPLKQVRAERDRTAAAAAVNVARKAG
jgi:hypothetical protein